MKLDKLILSTQPQFYPYYSLYRKPTCRKKKQLSSYITEKCSNPECLKFIGKKLHDIEFGDNFLGMTPKPQAPREK
jgi:hypothetical protein